MGIVMGMGWGWDMEVEMEMGMVSTNLRFVCDMIRFLHEEQMIRKMPNGLK